MKKIVYKLLYICILAFAFMVLTNVKVQAASVDLTATTNEPREGESVTVTASVTAGAWNLKFEGNGKSETIYGFTQSNANASDSKTITFTAGSVGTSYTFTLVGDMTDISSDDSEQVNKSITITVKAPTDSTTGGNQTPPATEPAKSSEARLSNFGIKPNDFSGFKRDKTEYSAEVPNNVSEVQVYATTVHKNAKVDGIGKVSLKEGNNTVKVTVTAEDGKTTKTYTLTIKRRTAAEEEALKNLSDATLKNLGIKPAEYDFKGFKKDTLEYTAEVPNEIKEIEVYATATDAKAQIKGSGMIELAEGENNIEVEVIAQDGTKKTYTIKVTRKVAEIATETTGEEDEITTTTTFGLSKLDISGITLNPSFKVGTYEYTADLEEDISSLEITAKANDKDATIEIVGNEDLKVGENIITILVSKSAEKDEEEGKNATYQIIVNKKIAITIEEIKTSWLKPSTWGKEEIIKIVIIVVLIILIICAVILKINISKENKKDKKVDLPGAQELDKAIAEHQELSEEEIDKEENSTNQMTENGEIIDNNAIVNNIEAQERTKKEVQKFLQEDFMQDEVSAEGAQTDTVEVNRNTEFSTNYIEDIAKNRFGENNIEDDFGKKPRRRGKHF